LDVTVEGPVDPDTGFVMNLRELKKIVESRVLVDVDHKNLNNEVRWLDGINPSTENVAVAIWGRIADQLPSGVRLVKVMLRETDRNWVEYSGPSGI
jgi:6-pyruvoyltetrahydropterin/6-carboxytetrahydropterin synthase